MFDQKTYIERRKNLRKNVSSGVLLFLGNQDVAYNYPANPYTFRQDSNFLYFFGLKEQNLAAVIDVDSGEEILFGNDADMDDIIWMGPQPLTREKAASVGVDKSAPLGELDKFIKKATQAGRKVHFLPPYRGETKIQLEQLLEIPAADTTKHVSEELIKAVVKLRSYKSDEEVAEIERMVDVAYNMHTTAMKMAYPGIKEQEIVGKVEGIPISFGGAVSFPVILSMNGETLHNHYHGNILQEGRLMVIDTGADSEWGYASDITRTVPVGGKFSPQQKEIYEIVLKANEETIKAIRPGVFFRDLHWLAAEIIVDGLKGLGLMKGDTKEAVKQGAHAMFFPHGLGHMMGMEVHDMDGIGENFVGYDDEVKRSDQFGLAFLRLGRRLEKGFVVTIEPGCYFIPALIDLWKKEGKFTEFINYEKVETYKSFGGVRIEDDILVTENGYRLLGKPIPKTVSEIENTMKR